LIDRSKHFLVDRTYKQAHGAIHWPRIRGLAV